MTSNSSFTNNPLTVTEWEQILSQLIPLDMNITADQDKYDDILLNSVITEEERNVCLSITRKRMFIGNLWQRICGNIPHIEDLGIGHPTGLDLKTADDIPYPFAMELKNSYNTDNNSSKKRNLEKLANFKTEYPQYNVIYGFINTSSKKNNNGDDKIKQFTINKDGKNIEVNIRHLSGNKLLRFLLGEEYNQVVSLIIQRLKKVHF